MKVITRVAAMLDNEVFSLPEPYRHHHVLAAINRHYRRQGKPHPYGVPDVQGFVNLEGMFMDRSHARQMFLEYGQEDFDSMHGRDLFSENCWTTPGDWQAPPGSPAYELFYHNNNHAVIDGLLTVEPFMGSRRPYHLDTVLADIYYRDRVLISCDHQGFSDTPLTDTLYSQLYEHQLTGVEMLERIYHYFATKLPSSLGIKYVYTHLPRSSYDGTEGDES